MNVPPGLQVARTLPRGDIPQFYDYENNAVTDYGSDAGSIELGGRGSIFQRHSRGNAGAPELDGLEV